MLSCDALPAAPDHPVQQAFHLYSLPIKRSDVRLSKLKLAGFKTFVDPTTVQMPGNLVGVVGPNGCGKSNIIDAVRWVLGETRASALRGESMQDVIFNGSTTRKPVSRASVELVFDNQEGRAAGQWSRYAEISVKRVLDRSGESTYYINNVHVRRKDVIDLFLGTGLGPRAYAIIEQGMISRIIEARPEEIRGFLEEAAGVTKYRERRKETEGRLSDARDNLARLDDIRMELGERIGHLEAQAAVAERFHALNNAHVEKQQLLWLIKRNEARAEQMRLADELNRNTSRIETDSARLQELEAAVEQAREAHLGASEAVHGAQSDLFAVSAEVARLETELQHLGEARRRLEARLTQLEIDRTHWQARQSSLTEERTRWHELAENAAMRVEQADGRHVEIADRLPDAESARQSAEATVTTARRELAQTEQQLRVEEANRASAARALDALQQRRARLEAERGAIQGPDAVMVAEREARLEAMKDALEAQQHELMVLQARQPEAQAALKAAMESERAVQRRLTELRARRDALMQLQAKVQSQGKLGDWLKRLGFDSLPPLWRALRVAPGWESAVEAVLRERLAALTVEGAQADGVARSMLDELPPDSLALGFIDGTNGAAAFVAPASAQALIDKVTLTDVTLRPLLEGWLSGCFVVDRLDEHLPVREQLQVGVCLVSQQGQVLTRHSLTHFVPDSRTHGVMERQRDIDQLTEQHVALDEEAARAHEALTVAEAAATELQDRINHLRREVQTAQAQVHAEQVEVLKLSQARSRADERCAQLEHDLGDLVHLEATEREHQTRAELEHGRAAELAELQAHRLDAAMEVMREREQSLRELRALEQACARELQEARFSERECAGKLDDIARNLQLAIEQLERIETERRAREQELEATDEGRSHDALQTALGLRASRETALAARRDALEQITASLRQTEELRMRTEQEAVPIRNRVAELRLAVQAAEMASAQFDERLVEAGADENALAPLLATDPKETTLQREVARLAREIAELGAVNLAALDELRAASERKGYLDAQTDDLLQAISTLEDAIRRIDRETREQLQETYNTVNRQFSTLFPQLFGGGRAELVLTGDEILDAGIQIVAQPPGKKNASIQLLSGGEKALTAIALVFAMFQLNPAPFCMLDEVDAPLDDTNTERYGQMVKRMSSQTQFIFISHSKITMEIAQQLVGVTMQEQGVSRVVEVDIEEALRLAESAAA
ncbi:chromosome segregation protein SMC [Azoarcus communis]|uniref:Chromosome partition protein Smc n=1 Tax=Parazoarcus communis SWub3 = DSM 12120 TaxID=1121029 RepID=A0A323UUH8_9RHOO|nr:chromosome segregation protein SMC [Parazoarcus communis SWub3 = DSM 12120]PZA15911.1 chromosome segregation protein SMC [Azoarcus communis] [Parazoarcus communis SWub3 = DSM 12120]